MDAALPLALPTSRAEIAAIQSRRKREAFLRARTVPWYAERLAGIDPDRLDEPDEWRKIPILDKDTLRRFDHAAFMENFCCAGPDEIAE
ncbi:MAG: hypothetical protein JO048_08255, partial [Methylobacteriaceae bacterium]|nr:hypothetical protein [Methylobacteriaceae bacterium]